MTFRLGFNLVALLMFIVAMITSALDDYTDDKKEILYAVLYLPWLLFEILPALVIAYRKKP